MCVCVRSENETDFPGVSFSLSTYTSAYTLTHTRARATHIGVSGIGDSKQIVHASSGWWGDARASLVA